jgi:hypothetical protein
VTSRSATFLRIGLLGASAGDVAHLAGLLGQRLHDQKIEAQVEIIDAPAGLLDIARLDRLILLGLGHAASADAGLQAADTLIRTALRHGNASYQVLCGDDEQRLQQALNAVLPLTHTAGDAGQRDAIRVGQQVANPWSWICEKCSDAGCEHKLLTDLLKQRQRTPAH